MNIESLLEEISTGYARSRSPLNAVQDADLVRLRASQEFNEALHRFDDPELLASETAGIYAGGRLALLAAHQGWTASLVERPNLGSDVLSPACPTVTCLVRGASDVRFERHDVRGLAAADPVDAKQLRMTLSGEFEAGPWSFVEQRSAEDLFGPVEQPDGAVFLEISGPAFSPYMHAYARVSGRYQYSSFSTTEYTGSDLLARLVRECVAGGLFETDQKYAVPENVVRLTEAMLTSAQVAPTTRWTLIQVLGRLSRGKAAAALADLAMGSGAIADRARSTLANFADVERV